MIYKEYKDLKLSALGLGAMRLPTIDGDDNKPDQEKTNEMVAYAMEHGINYYDTAWGYHGGNSEIVLGNALARFSHDDYYLADKFPGYDVNNFGKHEEIFSEQLKKCRVDYFDFYLIHNVCELNIEQYLDDEQFGTHAYFCKMREEGKIRHLGFSCHGSYDTLKRYLEAYGDIMEFCQLQINYLDWEFQEANKKVALLKEYNLPVWVMEPLRGGRLCNLTDEQTALLKDLRPQESLPGWAFRFVLSIPEVKMILSGMSNFDQLKENIAIFESEDPLNEAENAALKKVAEDMLAAKTLPCTACHYCTSHCPQNLDIPELLAIYNEHAFTGGGFIAPMLVGTFPEEKKPSACIGCGSCEQVCPQQIKISEAMADFAEKLAQ